VKRHHNHLKYGREIKIFNRVEGFVIIFLNQQFNIQLYRADNLDFAGSRSAFLSAYLLYKPGVIWCKWAGHHHKQFQVIFGNGLVQLKP
jgi:hypothetical protein